MNDDQRPRMDDAPSASTYGLGDGTGAAPNYGSAPNHGSTPPGGAGYTPFPHAPGPDAYGSSYGFAGSGGYGAPSDSDRSLAAVAHVATLIGALVSVGWLGFVVPLVMWFLYKDRSPFVRQAAAGAFNFNIGMWIANAVAWILFITVIGIPIALVIWAVAGIMSIVCHILGTLRAMKGETFRYPFQLPILR